MNLPMSEQNIEYIAEKLARKLIDEKRAKWVDPDTHEQHHQWIVEKINIESERARMRHRIIESSLAWALPLAIGFLLVAVWQYIKRELVG